jgi:hypothetical protein
MNISLEERNEIYRLRNKIANNQATSAEMNRYLNLIIESSDYNRAVVEEYVREIGYDSIEDYKGRLNEKNSEEFINGLLLIGGAVLVGYLINKLSNK